VQAAQERRLRAAVVVGQLKFLVVVVVVGSANWSTGRRWLVNKHVDFSSVCTGGGVWNLMPLLMPH